MKRICTRALVAAPIAISLVCQSASGQESAPPAATTGSSTQAAEPAPAGSEAVLPDVEVVQETGNKPKQQKYPAAKVAKKNSAPVSAPTAASSPPQNSPSGEASAPAASVVPAVATTGSLVGDRQGVLNLSGSGHVADGEELYTSHVFTTNEALRKVPGVNVRDEEGFGIRPNIGIRGLNPTRSSKTLLLEDGLFLTYAPYGDNASYFHPSLDRFERVEAIKGADQLLYGPQTISGTINYVTPTPPRDPAGFVALTGGNRDYFNGQFNYGGWYQNFGGLVDIVRKQGKGARDNTEHEIIDGDVKGIVQVSPVSAFIGKLSYFTEDSTVTYSGITDAERANFGIRYNPFKNDTFETERVGTSLTHNWDLDPNISLATSIYYQTFSRDWWRQSSRTTDTQCGNAFRDARLAGIAVDPDTCNSTQGRLRDYYTYGAEQRWDVATPITETVDNRLKFGYRYHEEYQERQQQNGTTPTARTGTLVENNERNAAAFSIFAQDRLAFGPFSVTPAVRYEDIDYERRNLLNVGGCASPPCVGKSSVQEVIPGISVGFDPSRDIRFFAGVHEGFAPPRVEDSISNSGGSIEVDAEKSTNIEVGFKSEPVAGLKVDGTYFRNDFDNLVAAGSVAGGDQPLAQGQALFEGFELFARLDSSKFAGTANNVYAQVAWTYLWDAEQSDGFRCVDQTNATCVANGGFVQGNTAGNRLPYAPEHLVTARIGYAERNFDAHVEMVYVGSQYADFLNLERGADHPDGAASVNARSGQFGEIDSYTIINVGMTYTIEQTNTDLFFAVKNVFDDEYIVDRTRGILPGAPRLIHVGLKQDF